MSRHADLMDAAGFWRQFVTGFYFEHPGDEVKGTLVGYRADGPIKDPTPEIRLQTDEGRVYRIVVTQERLKAALVEAQPARGDRLWIKYVGEAEQAAPGFSRAKLFEVKIRRQGSQPQGSAPGPEASGEVGSENVPAAGES